MTEDRTALVRDFSAPLAAGKGWMKFIGIVMIIQGVLTALTIIGILFAWLPIWLGVLLMQSASSAERAQVSGDEAAFRLSLDKLRSYFVIQGVLMIIAIAMFVLMLIFYGVIAAALISHAGRFT